MCADNIEAEHSIPQTLLDRVKDVYNSVQSRLPKKASISHVGDAHPDQFDRNQNRENLHAILCNRGPLDLGNFHRLVSFAMGHSTGISIYKLETKTPLLVSDGGPEGSTTFLSWHGDRAVWPNVDDERGYEDLPSREEAMTQILYAKWHVMDSDFINAIEKSLGSLNTLTEMEMGRPECVAVAWAAAVLGYALLKPILIHPLGLPCKYVVATLTMSLEWYTLAYLFRTAALPHDCDERLGYRVDAFRVACDLGRRTQHSLLAETVQKEANQLLKMLPPEHELREEVHGITTNLQKEEW